MPCPGIVPSLVEALSSAGLASGDAAVAAAKQRHGAEIYYPAFDYLRMLLALGVFVSHANTGLPHDIGNFCVQVFFALSGFLIGSILTRTRLSDLPRFYFKRTTRIWIPYAIAIVLLFLGCLAKRQELTPKLGEYFFYKATFVYNRFGLELLAASRDQAPLQGTGHHFWSICVEEQFYLVAPLIMVLFGRLRVVALLALLVTLPLLGEWVFTSILLGVLLAVSHARFGAWYRLPLGVAALGALLALAISALQLELVPYVAAAPLAAVSTVGLLARTGTTNQVGTFLGGLSYPFYLNHWIGLVLIRPTARVLGAHFAGVLVGLLVALVVSGALYWFVDRQVLRRRDAWYTPTVGRRCCEVGFTLVLIGFLGAFVLGVP